MTRLTRLQEKVLEAFLSRGVPVKMVSDEDGMDVIAADGEGLFLDFNADPGNPGIGGYKDGPWRLTSLGNGDFLLVAEGETPDWLPRGL
jgi:hypothetical protein